MPMVQLPGERFSGTMDGTKDSFSTDLQVLQELEGIFSIFEGQEFVGVIQKIRQEDSNLHIGRFFINPQKQGQGLGRQAFKEIC